MDELRNKEEASPQHIIWDWNGTILDDAHLCVESLNTLLKKRCLPRISPREYQREFRFPVRHFYEKRGFDFTAESYDDVANEFIDYYHQRRFTCALREGVLEVFRFFQQAGCTQSILSAYKQESLEEALVHYKVRDFFCRVDGLSNNHAGSKVGLGKAHLAALAYEPQRLLYIGDTDHDAEVAREMGVACILLDGGHQDSETLLRTGCHVCSNAKELISSWLKK